MICSGLNRLIPIVVLLGPVKVSLTRWSRSRGAGHITDFNAPNFPEATGGGHVLLSYQPGRGFSLESDFAFSDEVLNFVGEYRADSGVYNFYLIGTSGGETATGVIRSSARVEIRSSGTALWTADTYSYVDGKDTQVQSYRFTRRSSCRL
jgi:hypothetical protein